MKYLLKVISVFLVFVFVLNIPIVEAANTNSTDLERDSTQYWSITDGLQTGLDLTGNFTLEAWIKLESTAIEHNVIAKTHTDGYQGYIMRITDSNKLRCYTLGNNPDLNFVDGSTSLSSGVWYHLACLYNGSTIKAYLNGNEDGSTNTTVNPIGNAQEFRIGLRSTDTLQPFDGLVDEVRVWNTNRTQTQIQENKDRELTGSETNLQGYWQLDGNGLDETGNNNDLNNNNSATFSSDISTSFSGPILSVRKDINEYVFSTTTLQNDDDLILSLNANTTYIVEGAIFASSTSATPDLTIAFTVPNGAVMDIGYVSGFAGATRDADVLTFSGVGSSRIQVAADSTTPAIVQFNGTIKMGATSGSVILQWAQATSNAANITVKSGSYLRAEEI